MFNFFNPQISFYIIVTLFLTGAVGSLVLRKNDNAANFWGNTFAILGSFWGLIFSGTVLLTGKTFNFSIPTTFPSLSLTFGIDYLSAFFVFLISLIGLLCSIYAFGYVKHYFGKYNIGNLGFLYNLFILSVIFVVTAHNSIFFLIVWEIMALTSYLLVIFERNEDSNVQAGTIYFLMTHVGTAFIILSFLLLYKVTGSFEFDVIKNNLGTASGLIKNIIFFSALIGFGIKAGIIPLHIWLPSAHPAAPSHVSAILSGVMIKTGIYMLARIYLDFIPQIPLWWGLTVLVLGSISAVLGVLYALFEHDIKRLLAFHSIENIGIILLGLGSAMVFSSMNMKGFAVLALVASLFHTMNHATFKALLFLGAGSVINQTHTRNIEEYGGLIRMMPFTAFFFLIGSMAISALPPFNGFFSEWITYQSLFNGVAESANITKMVFITSVGALALTGGLAAACFVKAFGITFLARPRSQEAIHAHESSFSMKLGMGLLALLTFVFGFFAGPISRIINTVASSLNALQNPDSAVINGLSSVHTKNGFASLSMPGIFIITLLVTILIITIVAIVSRKQKIKKGITWDCGTTLTSRMEITATGFSRSIVTIFKGVLRPTKQIDIEYHDASLRYFPKTRSVILKSQDIYKLHFYKPLHDLTTYFSEQIKKMQSGNINTYILYILVTLIGLLIILAR